MNKEKQIARRLKWYIEEYYEHLEYCPFNFSERIYCYNCLEFMDIVIPNTVLACPCNIYEEDEIFEVAKRQINKTLDKY